VVLLPLAAIGVVVMAIKRSWHERFRWAVLAIGAVGTLAIVLAASAGESLESRIINVEGQAAAASWEQHSQLGETARNVALVFFVILLAYVLVPWWLERRATAGAAGIETTAPATDPAPQRSRPTPGPERFLRIGVTALALLGAAACVTTIARAGHSGSKSVWEDYVNTKPAGG
jgi:di/tricarboxylate transporter